MADPISRTDALRLVLERVRPLPVEDVDAASASGRVLAEPATATIDLPPFPSSAMDGFAVRASDTPGHLRLVGESVAGRPWTRELAAGETVAISTGSVVPVEITIRDDGAVEVPEVQEGAHVRPAGGDVRAGDVVVRAGARLGAPQLAALAAAGVTRVRCARR